TDTRRDCPGGGEADSGAAINSTPIVSAMSATAAIPAFVVLLRIYSPSINVSLEYVFQSKLHDSWIQGGGHLTERSAAESYVRVIYAEGICNVEPFHTKFQFLCFTELKCSGHGCVELPSA